MGPVPTLRERAPNEIAESCRSHIAVSVRLKSEELQIG
ncbi:hypothetical protein I546_1493 [Mycobacterium kansasii 732]|nr:hypothetical protein I546_1493 [Mycobacterium kansasii 732]